MIKLKKTKIYRKCCLIILLTNFLIFTPYISNAQLSAEKLGFRSYSINDDSLGVINYYVHSNKIDSTKPILLYIDGSGAYPLFQYTQRGIGSTVPIDYELLSEKYHVILISKPGVPFIDSVKMNYELGFPEYDAPEEYNAKLSLDWRVNSADLVIKDLIEKLPIDSNKIFVLGISEGFQVGAKLLHRNKNITHAVLMVGNGLNQFYDFIIQNRIDAQKGKIGLEEAQEKIDSLHVVFKDIYENPTSITKTWQGHTYLRWASFCNSIPADYLLESDIPILIISCSNDRNTSALSTDYIALESLKRNKTNIQNKVYPYDHFFTELILSEDGSLIDKKRHMTEVIDYVTNWINNY